MSVDYSQTGISQSVCYSKQGARVRNNSGTIEIRNNADTVFTQCRGADPVGNDDFATKRYVDLQSSLGWSVVATVVNRSALNKEFILIAAPSVEITLPNPIANEYVACKVISSTITDIQIKTNAAGILIDGTDYSAVGIPLTVQYEQLNFVSDGTDWFIW